MKKYKKILKKQQKFNLLYIWEGINFASEKDHWKKSEKNNVTVARNVFCM